MCHRGIGWNKRGQRFFSPNVISYGSWKTQQNTARGCRCEDPSWASSLSSNSVRYKHAREAKEMRVKESSWYCSWKTKRVQAGRFCIPETLLELGSRSSETLPTHFLNRFNQLCKFWSLEPTRPLVKRLHVFVEHKFDVSASMKVIDTLNGNDVLEIVLDMMEDQGYLYMPSFVNRSTARQLHATKRSQALRAEKQHAGTKIFNTFFLDRFHGL